MKEILESIDKLQADLDSTNAVNATLKNRAKIAKDQVANLQWQVQELQSQAQKNRATIDRIIDLEALKEMVALGGEMLIEDQDLVKKELLKHFPTEEFSQIDDIFPKEEEEDEQEECRMEIIPPTGSLLKM